MNAVTVADVPNVNGHIFTLGIQGMADQINKAEGSIPILRDYEAIDGGKWDPQDVRGKVVSASVQDGRLILTADCKGYESLLPSLDLALRGCLEVEDDGMGGKIVNACVPIAYAIMPEQKSV